jgi:hypothetical protein
MSKKFLRPMLFAGILAMVAFGAHAGSLKAPALEAWLKSYGAAWETRDAVAAGKLFTAEATYHEMPFDAPKLGNAAIQEYWRKVTADQRDVRFESKVIAVNGNTGIAHWKATFRAGANGAPVALDGVFVLEFDAQGRCQSLREWWHVKAN